MACTRGALKRVNLLHPRSCEADHGTPPRRKRPATVLACPLNVSLFNIPPKQLIDGVKVADPAKYYKETVIPADMDLTF